MKNPCWEGYEAYGFKMKEGRRVPNCVPKKSPSNRMPFHLELGSDGHKFKGKAIVVNSQSGKHYSSSPIPIVKAKAQMRVLEGIEYRKNGDNKKTEE
jgi:hypothetical protein